MAKGHQHPAIFSDEGTRPGLRSVTVYHVKYILNDEHRGNSRCLSRASNNDKITTRIVP